MSKSAFPSINELYPDGFKPHHLNIKDYIGAIIVFLVAFITYLLTMTPHICAGDSGELTTAIYNLGAAHPPGYPLYTMLGKIFSYIPVGDVATRVNLLSAFFGALSIPFIFLFLVKILRLTAKNTFLTTDRLVAATGSLLFAFSFTQWSQAVISEVYALNIVFAPMLLLVLLVWQERVFIQAKQGVVHFAERFFLLFAFILGMSFTNHLLLFGYFIPIVLFILTLFYIIREYVKEDPVNLFNQIIAIVVILIFIGVGGYMIYKYAWSPSLIKDNMAMNTLIGIMIPIIGIGGVAIYLMTTLKTKKDLKSKALSNNVLYWGFLILTGLFAAVLFIDDLNNYLNFMQHKDSFRTVLIFIYLMFLVMIVFASFYIKKEFSENDYFARSVSLLFKSLLFFVVPMLLYMTLLIRANAISKIPDPPLSWGETANSSRVLNHFLRKQYPKSDLSFFPRIIEIFKGWGGWHLSQFTPFLLLFVPFGLFSLFKRNKLWGWFTVAIFVVFNFLLLFFLSFPVTERDLFFNEVFFIPSYVLVVTWIVFGMQWGIEKASSIFSGVATEGNEEIGNE